MTYDEGNPELFEHDEVHRPRVECAMVQFPKEYAVICWLTEVLTTILVKFAHKKAPKFVLRTYKKLVEAMTTFFDESKAPKLMKSVILKLLSRLSKKLRVVYLASEGTIALAREDYDSEAHFAA